MQRSRSEGVMILITCSCFDCQNVALESMWPRGVTVSTLDSESSDRGSNPREASAHDLPGIAAATKSRRDTAMGKQCRRRRMQTDTGSSEHDDVRIEA